MTKTVRVQDVDLAFAAARTVGYPTLVVSGVHDPIAPSRLGRAIAGIASARFVEFAQAGHVLPVQCAEEVNALLLDHLARPTPSIRP